MCLFLNMKTKNKAKRKTTTQTAFDTERSVSSDDLNDRIPIGWPIVDAGVIATHPQLLDLAAFNGVGFLHVVV